MKILENDTVLEAQGKGVFQFSHLSFQEALAAQDIVASDAESFDAWATDNSASAFVKEPFNHNMLRIGGGVLGTALAKRRNMWKLEGITTAAGVVAALVVENQSLISLEYAAARSNPTFLLSTAADTNARFLANVLVF